MGRLSGGGDTYCETEMKEGESVGDGQGQSGQIPGVFLSTRRKEGWDASSEELSGARSVPIDHLLT